MSADRIPALREAAIAGLGSGGATGITVAVTRTRAGYQVMAVFYVAGARRHATHAFPSTASPQAVTDWARETGIKGSK